MSGRRLNTVYDYTSLRLHPDGSRVSQTSLNLRPRTARTTVQDSRGNWFARDAGGLGVVGRYKRVREGSDGEHDDGEPSSGNVKAKAKAKVKTATGRRNHDGRAAKRKKFFHDLDFLEPSAIDSLSLPGAQPLPSSDLLKCIHYFASQYYHERGQLFNASREYRQDRKRHKLMELEDPNRADSPIADTEIPVPGKRTRKSGRKKGGRVMYRKDMYRVMDGSTLMVIGMLVQEYVARMLEIRIPDGWEDDMDACADMEDEDDVSFDMENADDLDEDGQIGGRAPKESEDVEGIIDGRNNADGSDESKEIDGERSNASEVGSDNLDTDASENVGDVAEKDGRDVSGLDNDDDGSGSEYEPQW